MVKDSFSLPNPLWLRTIDTTLRQRFLSTPKEDDIVKDAIRQLQEGKTPLMKKEFQGWELDKDLLFYKGRCYVPNDESLRRDLVKDHYDSVMTGHPGQQKTLELLS